MSKYIFHEGRTPDKYSLKFERFLYNEERHRFSQSSDGWLTFSLIDENAKKIVAQIHFLISNEVALSPFKAPFGSFEFSASLSPEALLDFIVDVGNKLKEKSVRKIQIKDAPQIYRPEQAALLSVLLQNAGYKISTTEIHTSIAVDEKPWEDKISYAELKRLKKCKREKLAFKRLDENNFEKVYKFIQSCRQERGTLLSLTLDEINNVAAFCKEDFLLFSVFQDDEMIAASVSLKVNEQILYDFYHGHTRTADTLSPVVALIDGMYTYCSENGYKLIDLGTSSLGNKTNFSLLNFKTQLGGINSMKATFEKELK